MKNQLLIGLVALATVGCVGKKKFNELNQAKNSLDSALLQTRQDLANSQAYNAQLKDKYALRGDSLQNALNKQKSAEMQLSYCEKELLQCREKVEILSKSKSTLERDLADREARVRELEKALADRDNKLKELKDRIINALTGISSADLSVEERDGRIYVSLSQKLLFTTGSSAVGKEGRAALARLSAVLVQQADLNITVEGHTDSDGDDNVNWRLSADRALSITYIMVENKVPSNRITAAGRGESFPIAPNTTEEGKARNRRTEIILSPNFGELWNILKN